MGRKRSVDYNKIAKKYKDGYTLEEIAKLYKVAISTVHYAIHMSSDKDVEVTKLSDDAPLADKVDRDIKIEKYKDNIKSSNKKYKQAITNIKILEDKIKAFEVIRKEPTSSYNITPSYQSDNDNEGTVIFVASDWHIEEKVNPEEINFVNVFNKEIAIKRAETFFKKCVEFTEIERNALKIDHAILALLGDFINGEIHDEYLRSQQMTPIEAIILLRDIIISGIDHIMKVGKFKQLSVVCEPGNHSRQTKKIQSHKYNENTLEYLLYNELAYYYKDSPRIKFTISKSYYTIMDVYGYLIRFHHGHKIRYLGGVQGLKIPAFKAISAWNQTKPVNLDIFGHFHTAQDEDIYVCNGSLIGFTPFADQNKFKYEEPRQTFILIDKKRKHKTLIRNIFLDK